MKRRSFGLKANAIKDDDLYLFLEQSIVKYGSYRAFLEHMLKKEHEDQLGYSLAKIKEELKEELKNEVVSEVKDQLQAEFTDLKSFLKKNISEQSFIAAKNADKNGEENEEVNQEEEEGSLHEFGGKKLETDFAIDYEYDF